MIGPRPGSYLDSGRDLEQLLSSINTDSAIFDRTLEQNGQVPALDAQLDLLQHGDAVMSIAMNNWTFGNHRVPRSVRRGITKTMSQLEDGFQRTIRSNYKNAQGAPYEALLCHTAVEGQKLAESAIQPNWRITNFERWLRFGGRIAMLNLQHSMIINNAGRMPLNPDPSLLYQSLLRVACVSELIDNVADHELDAHNLPKKEQRGISSSLAMLLENETLIDTNEDISPVAGVSSWILPASPSLDFGARVEQKTDVFWIGFNHLAGEVYATSIDVKRKSENRKPNNNASTVRIDAIDLECLSVENRQIKVEHAARSRDFIQGHLEMDQTSPYVDPVYRYAVATAMMLVRTPENFAEQLSLSERTA